MSKYISARANPLELDGTKEPSKFSIHTNSRRTATMTSISTIGRLIVGFKESLSVTVRNINGSMKELMNG